MNKFNGSLTASKRYSSFTPPPSSSSFASWNSELKCNNCGRTGHIFNECKYPIVSYGVILFNKDKEDGIVRYLMLRRRNSFGYIVFLRGKYNIMNTLYLQSIFNEMSVAERRRIQTLPFQVLWREMWGKSNKAESSNKAETSNKTESSEGKFVTSGKTKEKAKQKKTSYYFVDEEMTAQRKFNLIQNYPMFNVDYYVANCTTSWEDPEWEFPKGRKNPDESNKDCALREFEEETGITVKENVNVIENIVPMEETFIGSTYRSYTHVYYVASMDSDVAKQETLSNFQPSEVSALEWKTYEECTQCIRSYSNEKLHILQCLHKTLTTMPMEFIPIVDNKV